MNIYNDNEFLISQNTLADLKGPKGKYSLHYGLLKAATRPLPFFNVPNKVRKDGPRIDAIKIKHQVGRKCVTVS